jgi:hypothetical protein
MLCREPQRPNKCARTKCRRELEAQAQPHRNFAYSQVTHTVKGEAKLLRPIANADVVISHFGTFASNECKVAIAAA